ncbi:unnamed protein product [Closterium sp. NIES-54]
MYLMTCARPDLAYPLGLLARYVAPGRHRKVHMDAAKRVLRYLCSTSGMGLVLGGRGDVVLTGHSDASWVDDQATQRSSQGYTFSLGSGSVSWRSTRSSSVLSSSCEAEIYATAMAAQELRWLTYLLTDLGERPRSPPVLYVDNKATIALCQEHRLEHITKHIALPEPHRPAEPHCPSACPASTATVATAATAAPAATAAMASPNVLTFDAEGRAVDFDVHLPPAERAHFGHYKTAQSLYDTVVAHYSSPATAALSRLMLPYLFPDLAAFATIADLIPHLRTGDARYHAALPTEFCHTRLSFGTTALVTPPCLVFERAAPHSSTFPPSEAPLQTLHMDVWGPACVRGQGHERYFLLVVDDYSRYTTVFPLRSKGEVSKVLIDWIRGARRQLSESFGSDLPVLRLHSDRGGEFSSDLLRACCRAKGIRQTFTLSASP